MHKKAMVIGGGVAGIQAALDLADMGVETFLVEKGPSIGGRMSQLDSWSRREAIRTCTSLLTAKSSESKACRPI